MHRRVIAALPVVVWVLAIAVAYRLHQRAGVVGTVTGFANDRPVTLAHLEPGVVQKVHVRLYDEVARGRVLVTMDDRQERVRLAAIEKEIERLRAEVTAERARVAADNARAPSSRPMPGSGFCFGELWWNMTSCARCMREATHRFGS